MTDDGGGRERNSCPLQKACLSPRGLQAGQYLVPAGGSTPSVVPAKGDITLFPLAWFNFIWGGGSSREFMFPAIPRGFGDPALPQPRQHLPWVAEVTRTVVTQRLQSAAAKRAMAKARGGCRTLSGLWGGSRPASPGYHSLAHQPEGGQHSDTGQELTSASPVGSLSYANGEVLSELGCTLPCSVVTLISSGTSSPWGQRDRSSRAAKQPPTPKLLQPHP